MKILSIISAGYEQGGAETMLAGCHAAFKKLGHESRIISSDLQSDLAHYSDYEFAAIPVKGLKKLFNSVFNVSAYRVTRSVLEEYRPDAVVLHTMHQITPAVLFLLKNYPTVLCVHGPEAFTTSLLPWCMNISMFKNRDYDMDSLKLSGRAWYWAYRYPYGYLYRFALRNVDRFIVFSGYVAQLMEGDGFNSRLISYVPPGVEFMTAPERIEGGEALVITYAGRLERYKGIDNLIDAMPEVLAHAPQASLSIAGEGSYADELKDRVCRLGLRESVQFLGHVMAADLGAFYANSLVTVVPSTWPEPFGKVGVEAMSVGTPVIGSDVGGMRDWLSDGQNGILVPPSEPGELAKAIIRVIDEPGLRAALSSNARQSVDKFSVDRHAASLLAVVSDVLRPTQGC
jgi:glycosyltransferase involved in cell wall biosynthesis